MCAKKQLKEVASAGDSRTNSGECARLLSAVTEDVIEQECDIISLAQVHRI